MTKLRKTTAAAMCVLLIGTAPVRAGGMAEPIVEAETIVEDTAAASTGGLLVPLLLLILVGALVAGGSGGTPGTS